MAESFTEFRMANKDTGELYTCHCADLWCARMLAADDCGGDPEDWISQYDDDE